jgi:hypothetical protein
MYMTELLCLKTKFIDGTESYSEAFDHTLIDRYPRYDTTLTHTLATDY